MHVQIIMSEKQAQVLMDALDVFSRLLMGQFEVIHWMNGMPLNDHPDEIRGILDHLKGLMFGMQGSSHGIHSPNIPDTARIAYDMLQVVRNKIAFHKHPKGGITVNFDDPMRTSTGEVLPPVKIVGVTEILASLEEKT